VHVGLFQERQDADFVKVLDVFTIVNVLQPGLPDFVAVWVGGRRRGGTVEKEQTG
jgi:hypothetical protein